MGQQDIIDRIISDAREAAAGTLAKAKARVDELNAASERRIAAAKEEAMSATALKADEQYARALNMANLEERKSLLSVKREVMDEAFTRALELLVKTSRPDKAKLFERILKENASKGDVILCLEQEAPVFSKAMLERCGVTLEVGDIGASGGFIIKCAGGQIDCTYEALIANVREDMEPQVAELLFPREA